MVYKLTLIELIAYYDKERDATAEHVEYYAKWVDGLPTLAAHAVDDILKVGRFHFVGWVGENEQGAAHDN